MSKSLIEKLEEKQNKLKLQINEAKKKEARKLALEHKKKCELIGKALTKEMKVNDDIKSTINSILDKHTKTTKDRKMLGLPTE